jgi:hypothetical protein
MAAYAHRLGARVQGDEREFYGDDGDAFAIAAMDPALRSIRR